MTYAKSSNRPVEEVDARLREAAQRHKFGVLHVHDLTETLKGKGIELGANCRVYDVCNPQAASAALKNDMTIASVLPCRIAVFSDGKGSRLATIRPRDLLPLTGVAGVDDLAQEVERELVAIIDEAA